MIRLDQIRMLIQDDDVSGDTKANDAHILNRLRKKSASVLGIRPDAIEDIRLIRHSIDARKKPELYDVYSAELKLSRDIDEKRAVRKAGRNAAVISGKESFSFPYRGRDIPDDGRPVIVGSGPAGMFCAYELAKNGFRPLVLERGGDVDERTEKVRHFWETGELDTECNVQFGEGGAGTFSDGKLTTGVKDRGGFIEEVLKVFVEHGAPSDILYEAYPHIGTDVLREVVRNIREDIIKLGGDVRFHSRVQRLVLEKNGVSGSRSITGVELSDGSMIRGRAVVLAIGHSSRDTFSELFSQDVVMSAKPFAVGVRVEHPQKLVDISQYGRERGSLPPAAYKLTARASDGRAVYTFCMCPGGQVINASSEAGAFAVNGMSCRARDGKNANSAVIAAVTPEEYGDGSPLSGLEFQRRLERRAFEAGKGKLPVQRYSDFRRMAPGEENPPGDDGEAPGEGGIMPDIMGEWTWADVRSIFPDDIGRALAEGIDSFAEKLQGFDRGDALVTGVESRTSSPVRIERTETLEAEGISGLYPCGEGAGYAGGITSAAMDGIKVALRIGMSFEECR